ncbi:hypothetical protein ASPZODRAFT_66952 [Penicilliopsis zonata CBS 506.65]|uniref:SMODS and SLOG-associating 2TM effector domain-containing protein n=1 Tax=Penicilliopsis zonata CBS 506.65 TaxID=1073090 RepID=A0A1L9SG56_9EURO|nr:hypothetical protein ASPZODRAFT_66952 [Penicilliopsis zonata CBS 506.65]OJJ46151.1 hypothetical protein ASPZODRAFT_66952 [Penicilliopsis zonata CBS 506.65]
MPLRSIVRRLTDLDPPQQVYIPPTSCNASDSDPNPSHFPPASASRNPNLLPRTIDPSALIPQADKLLAFRALTGIDSLPCLTEPGHLHRPAENIGIYARVHAHEASAAHRSRFFSILVTACLAVQIVVAASLTALGAARGPHAAITAFGAINTIVAGVLTYLKGSGLPDTLKERRRQWRDVREYIEFREREFCLRECTLDVYEEVKVVQRMYDLVRGENKDACR